MSQPLDATAVSRTESMEPLPAGTPDVTLLATRTSLASPTRTVLKDMRSVLGASLLA